MTPFSVMVSAVHVMLAYALSRAALSITCTRGSNLGVSIQSGKMLLWCSLCESCSSLAEVKGSLIHCIENSFCPDLQVQTPGVLVHFCP